MLLYHEKYENEEVLIPASTRFQLLLHIKEEALDISGTISTFYKNLAMGIRYPERAFRKKLGGLLMIEFKVDSNGSSNIVAVHGDDQEIFGKSVKQAFKKISGKWSSKYTGKVFILPIVFRNSKNDNPLPDEGQFDHLQYERRLSPIIVTM